MAFLPGKGRARNGWHHLWQPFSPEPPVPQAFLSHLSQIHVFWLSIPRYLHPRPNPLLCREAASHRMVLRGLSPAQEPVLPQHLSRCCWRRGRHLPGIQVCSHSLPGHPISCWEGFLLSLCCPREQLQVWINSWSAGEQRFPHVHRLETLPFSLGGKREENTSLNLKKKSLKLLKIPLFAACFDKVNFFLLFFPPKF